MKFADKTLRVNVGVPESLLKKIDNIAYLMDDGVRIRVIRLPVPLDPLIGIFPGAGDIFTFIVSGSVVTRAIQHGVLSHQIRKRRKPLLTGWRKNTV